MARYSDDFLESLNEATDIVGVVGQYVKLRKAGAEYKGLCPFHNEKSPSFGVNPAKGVFTCRGCGEKGNAAQFLVKHTGRNFRDVVAELAQRAGIALPKDDSPAQNRQETEIARLNGILQRADKFFRDQLAKSTEAIEYLQSRGVTQAMIERFGIGYAPGNGYALRQALPDVAEKDLIAAGLAFKSEFRDNKVLEYMRDRITFPIASSAGKTVAFGGRKLQESASGPKYLNTPETLIFKKSAQLFGLHQAGPAIRKTGKAIVVEGYMDVVIPSGNGIENVVSPMGTAFSAGALKKIFSMADEAVFCFDGDKAGRTAAFRALEISAEGVDDEHRTRYAFLPEGKDPDVFVVEQGAGALQEMIDKAEPMSKFLLREYASRNDMTCAEGKAQFASQTMSVIERIQAPTLKALMIEDVRGVLGPNIPLPGVTPGIPAMQPAPLVEPARSGFRAFRERAASAAIAAASIPSSGAHQTATYAALPPSAVKPKEPAPAPKPAPKEVRQEADAQVPSAVATAQPAAAAEPPNPAPSRSVGFRSMRSMVSTSRAQDDNVVPTPALRMMAFVLRDPQIAAFVTPNEAAYIDGTPNDVDALQAVCAAIDVDEETMANLNADSCRQKIVDALSDTEHADTVDRAMRLPEFQAQDMNVGAECAAIMKRCATRAQRRIRLGQK